MRDAERLCGKVAVQPCGLPKECLHSLRGVADQRKSGGINKPNASGNLVNAAYLPAVRYYDKGCAARAGSIAIAKPVGPIISPAEVLNLSAVHGANFALCCRNGQQFNQVRRARRRASTSYNDFFSFAGADEF